ncbi:hypothetical protein GQ42DRAFT_162767 [Ramicandelaber brevisporus]|nr:hypothetical protein GQ42DRAFT_162767 [Ramicandelaber brevisporus]
MAGRSTRRSTAAASSSSTSSLKGRAIDQYNYDSTDSEGDHSIDGAGSGDDFVVDDDGHGYAEGGDDDIGKNDGKYASGEEDEDSEYAKSGKKRGRSSKVTNSKKIKKNKKSKKGGRSDDDTDEAEEEAKPKQRQSRIGAMTFSTNRHKPFLAAGLSTSAANTGSTSAAASEDLLESLMGQFDKDKPHSASSPAAAAKMRKSQQPQQSAAASTTAPQIKKPAQSTVAHLASKRWANLRAGQTSTLSESTLSTATATASATTAAAAAAAATLAKSPTTVTATKLKAVTFADPPSSSGVEPSLPHVKANAADADEEFDEGVMEILGSELANDAEIDGFDDLDDTAISDMFDDIENDGGKDPLSIQFDNDNDLDDMPLDDIIDDCDIEYAAIDLESEAAASKSKNGFVNTYSQQSAVNDSSIPDFAPFAEPDGSLYMYYTDIREPSSNTNGTVYLIGRIFTPSSSAAPLTSLTPSASCCLAVHNVKRSLFVLPAVKSEKDGGDGEERYDGSEVISELRGLLAQHFGYDQEGLHYKSETKKYAFELPGIPPEADYIHVQIPYTSNNRIKGGNAYNACVEMASTAQKFAHVFGGGMTPVEKLILDKRLMGPGWIKITQPSIPKSRFSWCKYDVIAENPRLVKSLEQDNPNLAAARPAPALNIVSLSLRTVLSTSKNNNATNTASSKSTKVANNSGSATSEIVMLSMLEYRNVPIDDGEAVSRVNPAHQYSVLRDPGIGLFPPNLEGYSRDTENKQHVSIKVESSEAALLNWVLATLGKLDPDVIVSHNFFGHDLDVLLHRVKALGINSTNWSKLGRLRLTQLPRLTSATAFGRGAASNGNNSGNETSALFGQRAVMAGRIVCDTFLSAKDTIKSKSFSLTNLAQSELGITRRDVTPEQLIRIFEDASNKVAVDTQAACEIVMKLIKHVMKDAFLSAKLMFAMNALPLTKQLTVLAGNQWQRSLVGARAERNAYLLMHSFQQAGYILPDSVPYQQKQQQQQQQQQQPKTPAKQKGKQNAAPHSTSKRKSVSAGESQDTQFAGDEVDEIIGDHVDDEVDSDNDDENAAGNGSGGGGASNGGKIGAGAGRRKPAYSGGLVLEPKKGLHTGFVLYMDFAALYPSIVREFNICFTTVDRHGRRSSDDAQDGNEDDENGNSNNLADDDQLPDLPPSGLEEGVLPRVLRVLVERRKAVKRELKNPSLTATERSQLNTRQLAYKLTANSMYGCLGAVHSRFYAKPLAMLITAKGREILRDTASLASSLSLDVIYGDTDSIMVHVPNSDLSQVNQIGKEFRQKVNERYKLMELEIDGIFTRMLLLKKKKYAAVKVDSVDANGDVKFTMETRGLDVVRRDWCELSHDVSDYVLRQILEYTGEDSDIASSTSGSMAAAREAARIATEQLSGQGESSEAVDRIHAFLRVVGDQVRSGVLGSATSKTGAAWTLDKFVILKALNKHPEEYSDAKALPHVQVALRMAKSGSVFRSGDTVPYVICTTSAAPSDSNGSISERAYHPDEIRKPGSGLEPDYAWYLHQQVLPPVDRLCDPIEGTNMQQLADALGLDSSRYRGSSSSSSGGSAGDGRLMPLESQVSVIERFRDAERWTITCTRCRHKFLCEGPARIPGFVAGSSAISMQLLNNPNTVESGFRCPRPECSADLPVFTLVAQLTSVIRGHIQRYNEQRVMCTTPECIAANSTSSSSSSNAAATGTRALSVYGKRCQRPGCRGGGSSVRQVYSDLALYNQLLYFEAMLDPSKGIKLLVGGEQNEARIPFQTKQYLEKLWGVNVGSDAIVALKQVVGKHLSLSNRRFVDLGSLFKKLMIGTSH